jgi:hypothetical protein
MAEHKDLPNDQLHEPLHIKDLTAGSADVGKVIVAKGDGTSEARKLLSTDVDFLPVREVIVNSVDDFPAAVGGVITLLDRVQYTICDNFSIGTDRLVLSPFTVIRGIDQDNARIEYLGTGNMLTMNDITYLIQDVTLSAPNGTYFDHNDSSGVFAKFDNIQLDDDGAIGTFNSSGGSNFLANSILFGTHTVGLTLQGSWTTFTIKVGAGTIAGSGTLIDFGSATCSSIDIDSKLVAIAAPTATFVSGLANNGNINAGGLGRLTNCTILNLGGGTVLSGITEDDTRWRFLNNLGIRNSRPDALESFSGSAAVTTITTAATPVKINATWTDDRKSQFTQAADGRLTFVGEADTTMPITLVANLQMDSGSATDCKIFIAINGAVVGVGIPINGVTTSKPVSGTDIWQAVFTNGDYVEAWVENTLGTANIVVTDAVLRVN